MPDSLTILVLGGGPDRERPVSLRSAAAVAAALRQAGHTVVEADISPDDDAALDTPCDAVFPVLHGRFGEGGPLQEMLEARRLRYVGAGPRAAAVAMAKLAAKRTAEEHGVPTPPCQHLPNARTELTLGPPLVLKPIEEGSSFGVEVCLNRESIAAARRRQQGGSDAQPGAAGPQALMAERYIAGREITVGIVGRDLLPPIEIIPAQPFYDYEAKYDRDDTRYSFDIDLPAGTVERMKRHAWAVFEGIGCRHLGRVDFLVDAAGEPWFLEVNTMPGFTDHSLLPMAARRAGMDMPALCDRLVRLAMET